MRRRTQYVSLTLAVWLLFSAFLWPHSPSQFTNTWTVGALATVVAGMALVAPPMRYFNVLISVWLFASALFVPRFSDGTLWNNTLVAIGLFVLSFRPSGAGRGRSPIVSSTR